MTALAAAWRIARTPAARWAGGLVVLAILLGLWSLERATVERLRAEIGAPETGWRAKLAAMTADRDDWKGANGRCESTRTAERNARAEAVDASAEARVQAASSAYDLGYAAGARAGRRACAKGAPDAATAAGPAEPEPDRMRNDGPDLRELWERGAYVPRGPVPGGDQGDQPG